MLLWAQGLAPEAFMANDTSSYMAPAASLWAQGSFSAGTTPEIFRTPVYPALLALGMAMGEPVLAILGIQVLLSLATVALVYHMTRRLGGGERAAAAGALVFALEPLSILFGAKILTETTFTALLMGHVVALAAALDRPRWGAVLLAGLLLAAATLTRPVALGLPLVELPLLLWCWRGLGKRALGFGLAFALAALAPTAAWGARNMTVAGYPGLASVADHNLYYYRACAIEAKLQGRGFYEVMEDWRRSYDQRHPGQAGWTEGQRALAMREEAMAVIGLHPDIYAAQCLQGLVRTLALSSVVDGLRTLRVYPEAGGMIGRLVDGGYLAAIRYAWGAHPLALVLTILFSLLLALEYLAVGLGLRRSFGQGPVPRAAALLLIVAAGILLVAGAGADSEPRFRHPVMALVAPLVGVGVCYGSRVGGVISED
jgi:hypothetical protein